MVIIPLLLKANGQGFFGGFTMEVFSIGFIALDPDLVLVLTSRFKPDIPLILVFTLSPVMSTLLCLFSYWGYKSLDTTEQ